MKIYTTKYTMINHEHKFIFIHMPKNAGTTIGKALYELVGKDPKTYSGFEIHHDEYDDDIWKDYFVFTFTRDSHSRLLSQYRYRDFLYKHDFKYAIENMKELFEEHYEKVSEFYWDDDIKKIAIYYGEWIHFPTQKEFLMGNYSNGIDKRPYIDFYGKVETIQEDFDYVCKRIRLPRYELKKLNKSSNPQVEVEKLDYEY